MRPLRLVIVTVLTALSLLVASWPAAAADDPTATFTSSSRSFTPNGDGVNDVFETALSVSAAARVRVSVGSGGMNQDLLDRTVDGATTIPVTWDGYLHGSAAQTNRRWTLSATIEWAAGGLASRSVVAYPYSADVLELASPRPGAVLFGEVPIRWKNYSQWDFTFEVSDCGSFRQVVGGSGEPYPGMFDFSAAAGFQTFDAPSCAAGPHTLTVTGRPGWGMGGETLDVLSMPIVIPAAGPQLVLQPDLGPDDKVQSLLRYDDGRVAPVSWPVRCRDADPSSFVLRIRDADGGLVRTLRELSGTGAGACPTGIITPGTSWDGLDEQGEPVPDGVYAVEAEIADVAGRTAVDRGQVEVKGVEPPLTLTSVSAGDELGATADLVWELALGTSVRSISTKIPSCEARQPYGWFVGPSQARRVQQSIDLSRCPLGAAELVWSASWSDADGTQRVFTQRVPVTIRDETPPQLRQWGYGNLLTPSTPDTMRTEWFLTCADVSPVELRVVIRDSSGADVATLEEASPAPCDDWDERPRNLSWDGKDANGQVVVAGSYTAVARVSDPVGNIAESSWPITVDPRAPYRSSVAPASVVSADDVLTWTPRDGVSTIGNQSSAGATVQLQSPGVGTTDLPFSFDASGRLLVRGFGDCVGRDSRLSVSIDWRDQGGSTHTWSESVPIRCAGGSASPGPRVTIAGAPRTDQILRAQVSGLGLGDQPTYRWQRDGRNIAGATKERYLLTAADVGHDVRVEISVGSSPVRTATSPAVRVQAAALVSAAPTIRGTTRVGQTLSGSTPAWRPEGVRLSYQWLRDGRAVARAAGATYKVTARDRGAKLSVRVTGAKAGYVTAARTSNPTGVVR